MSSELENSQQWRFTWESQSHIPTLRLFLFHSRTTPALHCRNLRVHANLARSLLLVAWSNTHSDEVSITVPIPRALIDGDSPVSFKALDDHIEVKLVLLLPVGHPLVSSFDSILDGEVADSESSKLLSVDSDIQSLSCSGGVHLYCRNCEFNLTRNPLCNFVEMPSVNWREVADNWFDACCCSFGGISEKLVTRFANSYTCEKNTCLLDFATAIVCKDDLVQCNFPDPNETSNRKSAKLKHEEHGENVAVERLSRIHLEADLAEGCCDHHVSETSPENQKQFQNVPILENQKPFLNGYLGNIFMVRSSNLSRDVEWVEFLCPQCCSLLGAYPCANGTGPVDGGVRLFKCYISTSVLKNGSTDVFGKYTLERMFTNQLLEIAKDELSYRTVISDLYSKIPMLQLVLVNSSSWSCTGFCLSAHSDMEVVPKLELEPVIKVLFTECSSNTDSQMSATEDRIKEGSVDEAFMLRRQIEDTIECLKSAKRTLPSSYSSLQGLSLSSMKM